MSDRVENWSLPFMIYLIWVSSSLHKNFDDTGMSFPCSIENRCLPITINMVGLTAILKEEFD